MMLSAGADGIIRLLQSFAKRQDNQYIIVESRGSEQNCVIALVIIRFARSRPEGVIENGSLCNFV